MSETKGMLKQVLDGAALPPANGAAAAEAPPRLSDKSKLKLEPTLMQRTAALDAALKDLHSAITATEERIGSQFGDTKFNGLARGPFGDWLDHFAAHAEQMTARLKAINATL